MMRRRIGIIIVVTGIAAAALAAFLEPTQIVVGKLLGDPFFEGRPARYWARSLREGPAERADAESRLEQGGRDASPVLIGILTGSSGAGDAELRWTAAEMLGKLGPDASDAGPALIAGLRDDDPYVQAVCAAALPKVGVSADRAAPLLTDLLKSEHAVVAARALSQYRGAASSSLPALVELLSDKSQSAEARWNAARTIGKIGPDSVSAVPALIGEMDDKEWTIREHCAEAIGEIGPAAAPEAVAPLIGLLSDPVARVRRDAVRSLGQLGEPAREAAPKISELLDDDEEIVRKAAKTALDLIAPDDAVTSPR